MGRLSSWLPAARNDLPLLPMRVSRSSHGPCGIVPRRLFSSSLLVHDWHAQSLSSERTNPSTQARLLVRTMLVPFLTIILRIRYVLPPRLHEENRAAETNPHALHDSIGATTGRQRPAWVCTASKRKKETKHERLDVHTLNFFTAFLLYFLCRRFAPFC